RLSTIVNASKIIVLNAGSVVEEGNHETLMKAKGVYYGLVEAQNIHLKTKDKNVEENENDADDKAATALAYDKARSLSYHRQDTIDKKTVKNETNDKTDEAKAVVEYKGPAPFFAMLAMNRPELDVILFACIACVCNGGIQPAFGVILSKVIAVFQTCDPQLQEKRVLTYILIFVGLGVLMLFTMFLQSFLFAISGESLTQRLRAKIFRTLLQQDIAYFDQAENNTGALCT
ncbi:unnamed protein product, partial [Rotaria socialis]